MKKTNFLKILFLVFVFLGFILFFLEIKAETANNSTEPVTLPTEPDLTLPNPLGNDISILAARIIRAVLGLVGVFALVMFIYGGILWMTSGGSEEKIKKGKDTLVWAVLGLALIFFSYAILEFILKVILKRSV